jgi:hypothetical protein
VSAEEKRTDQASETPFNLKLYQRHQSSLQENNCTFRNSESNQLKRLEQKKSGSLPLRSCTSPASRMQGTVQGTATAIPETRNPHMKHQNQKKNPKTKENSTNTASDSYVELTLHHARALLGPARGARPADRREVLGDLLLGQHDGEPPLLALPSDGVNVALSIYAHIVVVEYPYKHSYHMLAVKLSTVLECGSRSSG